MFSGRFVSENLEFERDERNYYGGGVVIFQCIPSCSYNLKCRFSPPSHGSLGKKICAHGLCFFFGCEFLSSLSFSHGIECRPPRLCKHALSGHTRIPSVISPGPCIVRTSGTRTMCLVLSALSAPVSPPSSAKRDLRAPRD